MGDPSVRAIVTHPSQHGSVNWKMESVRPLEPREHELCVQIVASGICHTDLVVSFMPPERANYPIVLGHEGSGYVTQVGSKVTVAKVGDPVSLSFDYCKSCTQCRTGHPAFCSSFSPLNIAGEPGRFEGIETAKVSGRFFGQSSFSSVTVASESSVVNLAGLVHDKEELKLLAPFGCGLQTGSGTIANLAGAGPSDSVAVLGLGGVGLSAVMAAKLLGCHTIIAVDIVQSRLELAKSLGATHVVNSRDSGVSISEKMKTFTNGDGTTITVDTTGNMKAISDGFEGTASRGQMIFIGVGDFNATLDVNIVAMLGHGKIVRGSCEGDVTPSKFIPQMIQWYRDGKFPVEKLVKFYPAEKFEDALADMHNGATVKPVLVW